MSHKPKDFTPLRGAMLSLIMGIKELVSPSIAARIMQYCTQMRKKKRTRRKLQMLVLSTLQFLKDKTTMLK